MMGTPVCLVTGASTGVGRGIAEELAENGYIVYVTGRNLETLKEVKGGEVRAIQCDHTIDDEVDNVFERINEECSGRLDLLVNNVFSAAEFLSKNVDKPFWDFSPNAWDTFNHAGLRNHYRCSVLASRMMIKRNSGLIINISSIGGVAYSMTPAYGIGKCALERMASDCSLELEKYNVAFLSLRPCSVRTENFIKLMKETESGLSTSKEVMYCLENGESTRFVGESVRHLLEDRNVMLKSGQVLFTADVAKEYGFADNGRRPMDFRCLKDMLAAAGFSTVSKLFCAWFKLPLWLLRLIFERMRTPKLASTYE